MAKPVFYVSPGLISQELELVLQTSPVATRTKITSNGKAQRQVVAHVLQRLRWLYTVMITDEKAALQGLNSVRYLPEHRLQVRNLIQEGLQMFFLPPAHHWQIKKSS
jgi:hypothetical protein